MIAAGPVHLHELMVLIESRYLVEGQWSSINLSYNGSVTFQELVFEKYIIIHCGWHRLVSESQKLTL